MINPIKTRIPAKENKLRDVASEKHINTTDHLAMAPTKSLYVLKIEPINDVDNATAWRQIVPARP
jgi:hypothetical protein